MASSTVVHETIESGQLGLASPLQICGEPKRTNQSSFRE